jgi:integrase
MPKRSDVVLTDAVLRTMKRNERLTDALVPGLSARRGAADWTFYLRWKDPVTGEEPRATIGRYPAIDLDAARALARMERDRLARGETPDAKVKAQRRVAADAPKPPPVPTVGAVWEDYVTRKLAGSRKDGGRALDLLVCRDIGDLAKVRADRATPEQAQAILERIVARGARSMAQQFREALVAAYAFAHQQRRLDRNAPCPFEGLLKDAGRDRLAPVPKAERFRAADWKAWLRWLPGSGISENMRSVFLLQALTGARVGEIVSARFDQIDTDDSGRRWLRMFFKRAPRNIYMSAAAMRIVEAQRAKHPRAVFVFPSDRSSTGHVLAMAAVTAILDVRESCPIKLRDPRTNEMVDWSSHTLRRSVRAGLVRELKVPDAVCEVILGHSLGTGVRAAYTHEDDFEQQIVDAMEKWGRLIGTWSPRPTLRAVPA